MAQNTLETPPLFCDFSCLLVAIMTWTKRFLVAVFCAAGISAFGSEPETNPPALWFPVGEQLTYRIDWGPFPLAEAVATTEWTNENGRALIKIRLRTRSNKFFEKIHVVDDVITSLVDPGPFLPLRFIETVRETTHSLNEVTEFDRETKTAHWHSERTKESEDYAIEADTRDILSLLYFLRSRPVQPGDVLRLSVPAFRTLCAMNVTAVESKPLKLSGFGRVPCILMLPKAEGSKLFSRKAPQKVWISTDSRRLVIRMDARAVIGTVHVYLTKVEGPGEDGWMKKD